MGERLSLSAAFKVMRHKDNLRFNMLEAAFTSATVQEYRAWLKAEEVYERWFGSAKTK